MKIDNEAYEILMTLARRAKIVSDSKPADTIIRMYQQGWIEELTSILNKCTVIDNDGRPIQSPDNQSNTHNRVSR